MFLRVLFFLACFIAAFCSVKAHDDDPLVGGVVAITNQTKINELVDLVMRKYNNEITDGNYSIPYKVVEATEQVVAGELYRLTLLIGPSACKKIDFYQPGFNIEKCVKVENAPTKQLKAELLSQPWQHLGLLVKFV